MMGDMRQRTTPGKEPGCVENEMISAAAVGDGLQLLQFVGTRLARRMAATGE